MHIQVMYVHTYVTYEVTGSNISTCSTVCIFDICYSTNKYGCHIPSVAHTANMLYGHTDLTFFAYITQNTAKCTFYLPVAAKYVPEKVCPSK